MENYVITIARGFGSGGKAIGTKLAEELGIPCYERQLIDMASEYSGINKQLFAEVDEKLRGSYAMKHLMKIPYTYIVEPSDKEFTSDINLFNIQSEIIRELAESESFVVIGKCADYILKDMPNVISVYVEAPEKECIATVMDRMQVSENRAKELVHKTDRYRSDYYKYYTRGKDWKDPLNYDLTLNSSKVGWDHCVTLIKDYLKIKLGKQ
ncbi:MAG: cytidylate kinase-like family protein [Lachnospiraceae bacterium]|nr:cytidylate kinase-like family protein [Lachnospiraceae bacterium]